MERVLNIMRGKIDMALDIVPHMNISAELEVSGGNINVDVSVFNEAEYPAGDYYLKSRVVEDELVAFTNRTFHNVVRMHSEDIPINLSSTGTQTFNLTFPLPSGDDAAWNLEHTGVVIFVQNNNDKTVIQSYRKSIY